ncbi:MAG TPA: AAA family ATPase, partial [Acidimicrobiales bacterium]|nr:AAA family ATPase [Acidimicrobiales bacterium]
MAARDTTFGFTDIAGSTSILRELGEERYDALLERHRELIREALANAGGREVKTEGDGFFIAFHDAAASLRFALDAQRALRSEAWPSRLRVRMGFHRGPGTARADGDYSSLAAHQAARVSAAAHGGQVLLTADVVRDCDPPTGTQLVHLGEHRLRDFDGGVELLQLAGPDLDDAFPPVRAAREDHGLPLPRSSLVGREAELRQLRELLTAQPFVTLHGPSGVGKTRLALEAAASMRAEFPDGLHLVELSPVDDPTMLVPAISSVLRARGVPGVDPQTVLVRHLATGRHLLILDSAERVLDSVAELMDAIRRGAPGCTVLVTTTEPVRTPEERVLTVPPLAVPDLGELDPAADVDLLASEAVRLLLQRATARGAALGDGVTSAPALATIARRLDGIPLALELAAGRIADVGLDATIEGLDDRFSLLTDGWRTALPRHRTLEAMVEWTVALLDPAEQATLARLSALRGRWRPADAASACGIDAGAPAVEKLVDRALLWADERDRARVRMFDTVRAYAGRDLPADEAAELLRRKRRWLREHIRSLATAPDERIRGEIDHLIPDLREATAVEPDLAPDDAGDVAELTALMSPWFEALGLWEEAIRRMGAAAEAAPHGPQRLLALATLAQQHVVLGEEAIAAAIGREVVDDPETPDSARALALLVVTPPSTPPPAGDGDADPLEEALRLAGPSSSSLALAVRSRMALRHLAHGDPEQAVAGLAQVVDLAGLHGRAVVRAQALGNLGGALLRAGRLEEAEAALHESRTLAVEARIPQVAATSLTNLSVLALVRGDAAAALALGEERLGVSYRMGDLRGEGAAHIAMANAASVLGQRARARDENRMAYEAFHKLEFADGAVPCLFNLAVLADSDGADGEAGRACADLVALAAPTGNAALVSLALLAVAGVAAGRGLEPAAVLLGAAAAHQPPVVALDPGDVAWLTA